MKIVTSSVFRARIHSLSSFLTPIDLEKINEKNLAPGDFRSRAMSHEPDLNDYNVWLATGSGHRNPDLLGEICFNSAVTASDQLILPFGLNAQEK